MKSRWMAAALIVVSASSAAAQQKAAIMPAAAQIASAIAPLPEEYRAGATVLGYEAGKQGLVTLKQGSTFVCLADDPADELFHVAYYHESLEPFMKRGRELRAQGVTGNGVDSVRYAEIESGKLAMPKTPAALYSLTLDESSSVDAATGAITTTRKPLYVIYISGATAESTGLPKTPAAGLPWIMFPGSPKAHIMFVPTM